jgi:acyl-CoA synthetase (AMP-forming)/AMP-acid ligase II
MNLLMDNMRSFGNRDALIIDDKCFSYSDVLEEVELWVNIINLSEIHSGAVVAIEGENSVSLVSLIFALALNKNIIVPVRCESIFQADSLKKLAQVEYAINFHDDNPHFIKLSSKSEHELYCRLRADKHAGIVLFSSGTTGKPKGIVLSFNKIINNINGRSNQLRILLFLNYDHIGGLNTILHGLCGGGCVIFPRDRSVKKILQAIQQWRVEVLPTTPTFINMLLMSNSLHNYDLSSLKLITYGTEAMSATTLEKAVKYLPRVQFKQTYGLSEVGILPTKSRGSNELWLKIGGKEFNYKIIDDVLWIKSDMAMLGYLNASAPFDDEGYFNTQDVVEMQGEYIRILGRISDAINIAGEKVYPAEVEGFLMQVAGVLDAVAIPESNPVTGMGIRAIIKYSEGCDLEGLRGDIIRHMRDNLESFKRPMLYQFTREDLHSGRFKKIRTYV